MSVLATKFETTIPKSESPSLGLPGSHESEEDVRPGSKQKNSLPEEKPNYLLHILHIA